MLDDRIVRVKVKGDFACFTKPHSKAGQSSYPCMTPLAARGILDSIFWKPGFQWYVRRIIILNPVRYTTKRNEVNTRCGRNLIAIEEQRARRNDLILRNVAYIIEASIFMRHPSNTSEFEKYVGMVKGREGIFPRRVKKGKCWRKPFLGTSEYPAEFMIPDGTEQPIQDTIPIGSMVFDIMYDADGKPKPLYFDGATIKGGILDCDVPENEQMIRFAGSVL